MITAVKNTDIKRGEFYLPWVLQYHQEPFLDSNNITESELLHSVIPTYQNPLQIYPDTLLNEYQKQETLDDTIDAILYAKDQGIDEFPSIKINGYYIRLINENIYDLFKTFVKSPKSSNNSTQPSTPNNDNPVTYRGMKSMRGCDFAQ
ncbi:hypothetical protein TRFO_41157 [Tritrichomonas foetus]|uniref:DSBA-like thioredoxin domain-containing protein n=1 Tax=Tritrichomonas foetus TaxID=1144522 RepID=A0A1J4L2F9_9EUKA|nr:hypothetical protein TRFO_41157 [Tritrichomonas foetus]|eukprot:OHT17272.1 hypothetical protein TRFO_41157 [Tritrichomonas foetus]